MYSKTRYQSVDKGPEDDLYEYEPTLLKPERNKGPSRCYNVFMTVVYFALLIMAVVALGTFGAKVAQIVDRVRVVHNSTANSCIIFATYAGTNENGDILLNLHSSGLCGYVFWGLTSVTIVVFVWLVYSIIQAVIGLKV